MALEMDLYGEFEDACRGGNLAAVKKYVEQGAKIHIFSDYALRWAAHNGHLKTVQYLIGQGANIHAVDDWALRFATENGHLQVVTHLRKVAGDAYKCHKCLIRSTCLELCKDFRQL
jgi:ankyrin repeat protein